MNHPMNPRVPLIAESVGVRLNNRLATRHHLFDGTGISLWWYSKGLRRVMPMSDHDIIHEIGHYAAAAPEQRDLPEYGLGSADGSHGQRYSPYVVDLKEAEIQECTAQLLSIYWGRKYDLCPYFSDAPNYATSWNEYELIKFGPVYDRHDGWVHRFSMKAYIEALQRFDNILNNL